MTFIQLIDIKDKIYCQVNENHYVEATHSIQLFYIQIFISMCDDEKITKENLGLIYNAVLKEIKNEFSHDEKAYGRSIKLAHDFHELCLPQAA